MTPAEIHDALAEIVQDVTGVPSDEVRPGSGFEEDLGADSLAMIEVVVAVDVRFGVKVDDGDVKELVTVDDMVRYVLDRRG